MRAKKTKKKEGLLHFWCLNWQSVHLCCCFYIFFSFFLFFNILRTSLVLRIAIFMSMLAGCELIHRTFYVLLDDQVLRWWSQPLHFCTIIRALEGLESWTSNFERFKVNDVFMTHETTLKVVLAKRKVIDFFLFFKYYFIVIRRGWYCKLWECFFFVPLKKVEHVTKFLKSKYNILQPNS